MIRAGAIALSLSRAAFGAAMIARPEKIAGSWVGGAGRKPEASVLTRSVGARDVVLGIGGALAVARGSSTASGWLAAIAVADFADLIGTLAEREHLPDSGVQATVAMAGGSGALSAIAAVALD